MRPFLISLICVLGFGCKQQDGGDVSYRFPGGDPDRGKTAFSQLTCIQCHRVSGEDLPGPSAPEYIDLTLGTGGRFVKSYEDIITAITNPQHVVDEQYAGILADLDPEGKISAYMPNSTDRMSACQLMDLTVFLDRAYRKSAAGYRKN